MNLIDNLFNTTNISCPRCLGKGHVDEDDLKRLKKELHWRTGSCAYCNGDGKVSSKMIKNLPADTLYLTTDLNPTERKKLFNNDPDAMERAHYFSKNALDFIKQVKYLHTTAGLSSHLICDFFLVTAEEEFTSEDKIEYIDYIEKVIAYN